MKDNTLIIIAGLGIFAYLLYKSGFFDNISSSLEKLNGDKYTQYAAAMQGLANNATGNFLTVHGAISQGINDQINTSVNTALGSISNWAQMAQQNRDNKDRREYEQFMNILNTI